MVRAHPGEFSFCFYYLYNSFFLLIVYSKYYSYYKLSFSKPSVIFKPRVVFNILYKNIFYKISKKEDT